MKYAEVKTWNVWCVERRTFQYKWGFSGPLVCKKVSILANLNHTKSISTSFRNLEMCTEKEHKNYNVDGPYYLQQPLVKFYVNRNWSNIVEQKGFRTTNRKISVKSGYLAPSSSYRKNPKLASASIHAMDFQILEFQYFSGKFCEHTHTKR